MIDCFKLYHEMFGEDFPLFNFRDVEIDFVINIVNFCLQQKKKFEDVFGVKYGDVMI